MLRAGHHGAALLAYAPVGLVLSSVDPVLSVTGALGSVTLARLPDWDRRVPFVQHRGVTHTLSFLVVTVAVAGGIGWASGGALGAQRHWAGGFVALVTLVAVGSHLLADALTPYGVPLLWPASGRRFSIEVTRADDAAANYGLLALGYVATGAAAYLGGLWQ